MSGIQKNHRAQNGFTIVELLLVIVVIAILAAITFATFSNISTRAEASLISTEAGNLSTQLETAKITNGAYPDSLDNVKTNGGLSYQYTKTSDSAYCATIGGTKAGYYYISNTVNPALVGICSGHAGILANTTETIIAPGSDHMCTLANGKPYCWGDNSAGQLGITGIASSLVASPVNTSGVLSGKTITAMAGGGSHTCVIANSLPYCWGANWYGQLGNNSFTNSANPVAVTATGVLSGKTATAISSSFFGSTCVVATGKPYCWGTNSNGQLGNNSTTDSRVPVAVTATGVLSGKTVTAISTGTTSTCVVADGKPYCWGLNSSGQLGNNSTTDSLVPVAVDTSGVLAGKTVTAVAVGDYHACAIASGKAYCWGSNWVYQLGDNTSNDSLVPVAVDTSGVLSGKTVSMISSWDRTTCALADGRAYCWGANWYGQYGDNSADYGPVPAVAASGVLAGKNLSYVWTQYDKTCAIADGRSYCWGSNTTGELGKAPVVANSGSPTAVISSGALSGKTVSAITTGFDSTCAVADSQAYCWGGDSYGQLGDGGSNFDMYSPTAVDNSGVLSGKTVTSISSAPTFMRACAVASGKAYCWGANENGQLGNNTTNDSSVPVAVNTSGVLSGKTVASLTIGNTTACAIASSLPYCWGYGSYGNLGNGSGSGSSVPVAVTTSGVLSGKTVTAVSTGSDAECVVASGKAYCWGLGMFGTLGTTSGGYSTTPVAVNASGVLSGKTVTAVSVGDRSACAIASGNAYCWGENDYGQLGNNSTTNTNYPVAVDTSGVLSGKTVTAISAGYDYACAIADGKPYCWGQGWQNQLGNGLWSDSSIPVAVDTSGALAGKTVTDISAGGGQTCVLADSRAYCWGSNSYGQLGLGGTKISTIPIAIAR